jgi:uncharacterized protein YdeI (YjbR/CyaY-like superfamily)
VDGRSLLDAWAWRPASGWTSGCVPRPADEVEVPEDVVGGAAGRGVTASWEALTPGRRRAHLHHVEGARTAAHARQALAALLTGLGAA